jgi:hypothetical protein
MITILSFLFYQNNEEWLSPDKDLREYEELMMEFPAELARSALNASFDAERPSVSHRSSIAVGKKVIT